MKKFLPLFFLSITIATACKKNDDSTSGDTDRKKLLIGTWKLTAQTYSPSIDYDHDGSSETDAYPVMEPCQKDNLLTFLPDGTWKNDFGSLLCDWEDEHDGNWTLSDDGSTLTADGDVLTILQLDDHVLKYQMSFKNPENGQDHIATFTLVRQ